MSVLQPFCVDDAEDTGGRSIVRIPTFQHAIRVVVTHKLIHTPIGAAFLSSKCSSHETHGSSRKDPK